MELTGHETGLCAFARIASPGVIWMIGAAFLSIWSAVSSGCKAKVVSSHKDGAQSTARIQTQPPHIESVVAQCHCQPANAGADDTSASGYGAGRSARSFVFVADRCRLNRRSMPLTISRCAGPTGTI